MDKVLILGASGLVGRALNNELKNRFDIFGTYSSKRTNLPEDRQIQLDVEDTDKLLEILNKIKPDLVISCLRGEFDQQFQFHKELAMVLKKNGGRMYFFSTTNVFDGDYSKHHLETDTPISVSDYGNFKIACEKLLTEILEDQIVIIRIPAIWGRDSLRWNLINESIKNNKEIDVFTNLVCNNLLDVQLAKQLRYIIENNLRGIFHLGSTDVMTHGQFYEEVIRRLGLEMSILRHHLFQESDDTYYFSLKSIREEIPTSIQSTSSEIISYLISENQQ